MSKIIPKDWVEPVKTGPLEITDKKKAEMVAVATAMVVKPTDAGELADKLEQHYVKEKNEHYTSAQLKMIVDQVAKDLYVAPEVSEEII